MTVADDSKSAYLSYPIPNDELIKQLKMIKHIEGGECIAASQAKWRSSPGLAGYFVETDRQHEEVASPFAGA